MQHRVGLGLCQRTLNFNFPGQVTAIAGHRLHLPKLRDLHLGVAAGALDGGQLLGWRELLGSHDAIILLSS